MTFDPVTSLALFGGYLVGAAIGLAIMNAIVRWWSNRS